MKSVPGDIMFNALQDEDCIIMACNTRITKGVVKGILRAAKEMDAAVMFELAKTESNLEGGYTGLTPDEFCSTVMETATSVGHDIFAMHADHIGIKKGTPEEMDDVKTLVKGQIDAGYTSFAIDASHIFNFEGKTTKEELEGNIKATIELAKFIKENMAGTFGLEVEVGEIGRKGDEGLVLTKPKEAVCYISELKAAGVNPHIIAIANGSVHGNSYDVEGNLLVQVSIDIPQTIAVGKALREAGHDVTIAQHGITGTPLSIIKDKFPKQYLKKGNVGTHWMNLVWDVFKEKEPSLYKEIWDWTLKTHAKPDKKDTEIFGKFSKYAIVEFKDKIYAMKPETEEIIEEKAYTEAKKFFDAFNAKGTAEIVRNALK